MITKSKQRSLKLVSECELPNYNGESGVVLLSDPTLNLLWFLARFHASEKRKICGWTGFNILVRNDVEVRKDNIGYLPTVDTPATSLSIVFEVLNQSLKVQDALRRQAIVVVFDQVLYAKATEIK